MTPYEVISSLTLFAYRIDIQWGLFITVHLAVFGGIIYVDRPLQKKEKVASLLVYSGFTAINYMGMSTQIGVLDSIYQELIKLSSDACCVTNNIIQKLAEDGRQRSLGLIKTILIGVHCLMFVLVALSIIFDQALSRNPSERVN